MHVNGGDWNAVLPELIPRLIAARNAQEYHLTLLELTTRLHDAPVGAGSPLINRTLGPRTPSFEARSIDGEIVVWRIAPGAAAEGSGLQVGDVIREVDGEPVVQRRRDRSKYVAAGNPSVFERKLLFLVMRGHADGTTYTIERDGRFLTLRVPMEPLSNATTAPPRPAYPVTELARVLPNTNIARSCGLRPS